MSTIHMNEEQGHSILQKNNDEISKWLAVLKQQREELALLIQKQEEEKKYLKTEVDRLRYKYQLVTKSLNQRIMTKERYDQTITEAEALFNKIVASSDTLLGAVRKDAGVLEQTINKKVGTENNDKTPSKLEQSLMMEVPITLISKPEHGEAGAHIYGTFHQPHTHSQVDYVFEALPQKQESKTESTKQYTLLDIGRHRTQAESMDYL